MHSKIIAPVVFLLMAVMAFADIRSDQSETNSVGMKLVKLNLKDSGKMIYIGATEVTQDQWLRIMGSNPSFKKQPTGPVEKISWLEAQEFCERLSKVEKALYRLPTATEWKEAAETGMPADFSTHEVARRFAWCLDDADEDGARKVATKQPSTLGIYDMFGNVAEWCLDKKVRGGSFLQSVGFQFEERPPLHESYKSNFIGLRVVMEPETSKTGQVAESK